MPRRHHVSVTVTVTVTVAVSAGVLLAGCGSRAADSSNGDATTLFEHRAEQVAQRWVRDGLLDRWRTSVVAAGGLTVEPAWTPRPGLKAAFGSGWVRTATALPTTPGTGTVTWSDGRTVSVRTLDAQTVYDAMVPPRSGPCPVPEGSSTGCDWATVTEARAVTTTLATARGPATVPAWSFTLSGLPTPLLHVAVEVTGPSDLAPADLPPSHRQGRRVLLSGEDVVSHTATTLTFLLGSGACDTDAREHVLETDEVVVVGGTALAPSEGTTCEASLHVEQVTVPLATDLGARPVIDASSGQPLMPWPAPTR